MRSIVLVAMIFGVAAAATNPSYLLSFGLGMMMPPGAGRLLARAVLLALGVGLLLGAVLTPIFERTTTMRFGALYATLLGLVARGCSAALASALLTLTMGYLDLSQSLFMFTAYPLLGALAGLATWTLLRLRKNVSSLVSLSPRTRFSVAALFAGATFLVCLTSVLPWEESGDYTHHTPTWRTPVMAIAVTALPAMLTASVWSAALVGYFGKAASLRFGFLYTLVLGFYTVSVAEALSGSFLNLYIEQRMAYMMSDAITSGTPSAFAIMGPGHSPLQAWALPGVSVLVSTLTWAYLRKQERT